MSDVKRYDAVHLRYEESNIRYGEGCEVEVVAAYDFDRTVSALRAELNACTATLPGTLYMDPPDGGDVSVPEQLARMAADAAKWRELQVEEGVPPHDGKLLVSREPLRKVLTALVGDPHHIRELQATRLPVALFADNPINILIAEWEGRA